MENARKNSSGRSTATLLALLGILLLSETGYLSLLRLNAINGTRPVFIFLALMGSLFLLYAVAYLLVRRVNPLPHSYLWIIATGAVLFRLTLLPAGLPPNDSITDLVNDMKQDISGNAVTYERFILFDSDHWRYLWDGHVWAHGINPFQYAPADGVLDRLAEGTMEETDSRSIWTDIRDNLNYADVPTIYPPLAQVIFRLSHFLAPGSTLLFKLLMIVLDLGTVVTIGLTLKALDRSASEVVLYAWNPLMIKVIAGSGHIDALLGFLLSCTAYLLIRRRRAWAGLSFGLALLSKVTPLILTPFVFRRIGWKYAVLVAGILLLGYLPFLGIGMTVFDGLRTFGREWQFNAGPFAFFEWLARIFSDHSRMVANVICGTLILAVLAKLLHRDTRKPDFLAHGALAMGALLILSPVVMPWYLVWVLPFAILAGQHIWVVFSGLVCIAFLVMIREVEYPWALFTEYGIFAILMWWEYRRMGRRNHSVSAMSPAAG